MRPLKNQTTNTSNPISPKKLLHSKWTAALPRDKEKHFMVTKLVLPEVALFPEATIEFVELEAVHSSAFLYCRGAILMTHVNGCKDGNEY